MAKCLHRRHLRLAESVEGAGQQGGDRAGGSQRRGIVVRGVLDVVGGEPAMRRHEARAAEMRELLGVKLHRQAELGCPVEDAGNLGGGEGDAFAEAVDGVGETGGLRSLKRRDADLVM